MKCCLCDEVALTLAGPKGYCKAHREECLKACLNLRKGWGDRADSAAIERKYKPASSFSGKKKDRAW